MGQLTTYNKLTSAPSDLLAVLKQEIGIKTTCMPFAVKALEALKTLTGLTESEALKAADVFLSDMQTLSQGGITAEDYDKIDFVKRGKAITVSARVEAFLRAAARKGYRITDTIIAVPKDDASTTYFKENFYNGEIVYTLEDKRLNADRKITSDRVIGNYFEKYICRLEVVDIKQNKRLVMSVYEVSNEELLTIAAVSEQGFYKSKWEEYSAYGKTKKRKVVTKELNENSFWTKWTSEMVNKTIIRKALKRVKEVLPELKDTIYAFERDENENITETPKEEYIDIPVKSDNVDLHNLTEQQRDDVKETFELFAANPKLAADKANEIKTMLDNGEDLQKVINLYYASIFNIKRSKTLYPIISSYFEVPNNE